MTPWTSMLHRIENEKQVSDVAYCDSLMNAIELCVRYSAALLIALLPDDEAGRRERYRWEHALLRASGIGSWAAALQNLAGGTQYSALSNRLSAMGLHTAVEQFTARVADDDWQHEVVEAITEAKTIATGVRQPIPPRTNLLEAFRRFVEVRNKLDAHGAPLSDIKSQVSGSLEAFIGLINDNLELLNVPLVSCRSTVTASPSTVIALSQPLDSEARLALGESHRDLSLPDGIYVVSGGLQRVALVAVAPDVGDFYVGNGDARIADRTAEALSYSTGRAIRIPLDDWLLPPDRIADSETAALESLVPRGQAYTNAPVLPDRYIERPDLQRELMDTLKDPRRFVLTLQGRGGIGKTSLALRVIDEACSEEMFDLILWFSARDIDLRDSGAVLVQPDVVTLDDLATNAAQLLADVGTSIGTKASASDWLAQVLGDESSGSILWVLDNFETLNNPLEVFAHFDAYIRSPHKALITTRHREFRGDYPITVSGMRQNEFEKLVGQESIRLDLSLSAEDIQTLFVESRGHPYVAKIMLGELKLRPGSKPRRVLEKRDDVLDALFERTFARLSNDARHAFLLLSTWRSLVPVLALDVVINGQRLGQAVDTEEAVDELEALSLVQVVRSADESWLDVPLPAWLFGRRKLITDPTRIDIEQESELLQLFGPAASSDLQHGLLRPAKRFWTSIRGRVGDDGWLDEWEPWLNRLGREVPQLWIWIAEELDDLGKRTEAERFLRRSVEDNPTDPDLWLRLAQHYESREDDRAALQAWVARALVPGAGFDDVSFASNKVNGWLHRSRVELTADERRLLAQPLVETMETRSSEGDAQDYSRLAWLYMNLGDTRKGVDAAERGLAIDPDQIDCRKFVAKFGR